MNETSYNLSKKNIEGALENFEGDHARYPYIWIRLIVAAIYAILAITEEIESK